MRFRDLSMLTAVVVLGVVAGIVILGSDSYGGEFEPGPMEPAPAPAPFAAPGPDESRVPANAAAAPATTTMPVLDDGPVRRDVKGWTSGIVRGDIQLAVSVLDRLDKISIVVEEARAEIGPGGKFTRKNRLVVPVQRGAGTPTFEVSEIPFSEYPYVVSVFAPGLNGSRRTVTIDEKTPLIEDIVLSITPGAPFSVRVRDQDAVPFTNLDVRMLAAGEPAGRTNHAGTTDNFGSVVFTDVLAGDYQVLLSIDGQEIVPPQTITVYPGFTYAANSVRGQQAALTVARGVPVQLMVHDRHGYGLADVAVKAQATDRTLLTEITTKTDASGRAAFSHLAPGTWQITFEKQGLLRSDQQLHLKSGQEPVYREVQLVPAR